MGRNVPSMRAPAHRKQTVRVFSEPVGEWASLKRRPCHSPSVPDNTPPTNGIDYASGALDKYLDDKVGPLLQSMKEGTAQLLRSKNKKLMVSKRKLTEKEIEQVVHHEEDAPFFEGHAGLRSFFAQALKGQIEGVRRQLGVTGLQRQLASTWFQDGKFKKLNPHLRFVVWTLATHHRDEPMTIYREVGETISTQPGSIFAMREPESWSATEKVVMGSTTLIANTRYGTRVSILSQFPGEAEVIGLNPNGYVVEKIEDRVFLGKQGRRVIRLRDNPTHG